MSAPSPEKPPGEAQTTRAPAAVPRPSEVLRLDLETLAPIVFGALFLLSLVGLVFVMHDYVADVVFAFVLVGLVDRPYQLIKRGLGGRAFLASGIATALTLLLVVVPVVALLWTLTAQATSAVATVSAVVGEPRSSMLEEAVQHLRRAGVPVTDAQFGSALQLASTKLRAFAVEHGGEILGGVLGVAFHLLTTLVIVFYLLVDGARLRRWLFELSPLPDDEDAMIEETFKNVARGVVYGNGLGSLLQGVLGGVAMWVAGFQSAVLWAAVMTVFAFLPLVGIAVVTVPATLALLLEGRGATAALFFVFCTAQGLVIENFVKTRLMGSAMRMHDLLVFLSVLGGISAFGIVGLVYGPLAAMLFITLADLYARRYRPLLALRLSRSRKA